MKKIVWISFAGFLVSHPVQAQAQTQDFNIKVNQVQLEMIGRGLGKLPFDEVAPLIQNLREQVMQQQIKPLPTNPPESKKK